MASKKTTTTRKATAKATKSGGDDKAKIADLLKKLESANGQGEKRAIRRALRAQGHKGGLGRKPVPPKAK